MEPKPVSLQLYTVRDLFAAGRGPEVMDRLAEIGFAAIEGIPGGYDAVSFRKWLDDRGMQSISLFGPIPSRENVDEVCSTLETLGARWWTSGFWIPQLETVEAIQENTEKLAEVLPLIQDRGFGFAMHNHWMEFEDRDGERVLDRMLKIAPDLQLEIDIYWAANFGAVDSAEACRTYADRTRVLHVKDGPLVRDEPMVAVGDGKVDIAACVNAAPHAEALVIELDHHDGDMMTAVERSFRFLVDSGLGYGRHQ